jgi:hypothetical protein
MLTFLLLLPSFHFSGHATACNFFSQVVHTMLQNSGALSTRTAAKRQAMVLRDRKQQSPASYEHSGCNRFRKYRYGMSLVSRA